MGKLTGRNGALYANITSSGTAEPIAYIKHWSVSFATQKYDVTTMGDTTMQYLAGIPDFTGDFDGFYDNATPQLYTAATDGAARKFYLYPDRATSSQYWFGSATFDFSVDAPVDGPIAISGGLAASGPAFKVG